MNSNQALLALGDGSVFYGTRIGAKGSVNGELIFNTSMTGYQEILTDPSYAKQIVLFTYPHIGNTGTNLEDIESRSVWASGLVIRDLPLMTSSWRNELILEDYLKKRNIVGISNIDTRQLARIIRTKGSQSCSIISGKDISEKKAIHLANDFHGIGGTDLAREVTTASSYSFRDVFPQEHEGVMKFKVVAYDFGIKTNILRILQSKGCDVTVVPATMSTEEVLSLSPDGIFLSNGPGDPEPCVYAVKAIKELIEEKLPIFGICLGHQLLGLSLGAKTVKMKYGHHGSNHPVKNLETGLVAITSQNHGFTLSDDLLPPDLIVTHRSLFDNSIQGIKHSKLPLFGFQGHPEASPGPRDLNVFFNQFIELMEKR